MREFVNPGGYLISLFTDYSVWAWVFAAWAWVVEVAAVVGD